MGLGRLHVHSFHGLSQIKSSAGSKHFITFTMRAATIGKKHFALTYYFTLIAVDNNCSSRIHTNAQQTPIRRHAFGHSVFPMHLNYVRNDEDITNKSKSPVVYRDKPARSHFGGDKTYRSQYKGASGTSTDYSAAGQHNL